MRSSSRSLMWVAVLLAVLVGATETSAQTRRPTAHSNGAGSRGSRSPRRPIGPPSASRGWANSGTLIHGRQLEGGDGIRLLPNRVLHWGTDELIGLLERVGGALRHRYGVRLTVGDLSAEHGGPVGRHRSHQSGRDSDVCFFARVATSRGAGAPVELDDYVSFDASGRSLDGRYVFDTARNWTVIDELLTDRRVGVERVFISTPLRARLLAYGREHGADESLLDRAALTLMQPHNVSPHDNHFHVRIGCPGGDAQCREGVRLRRIIRRRPAQVARARHASQHEHARREPGHPAKRGSR